MSAHDKVTIMEKLIALGWKEAPPEADCGSRAHYCLVPPDSLWLNKPKSFYVYDAEELQNLLAPEQE